MSMSTQRQERYLSSLLPTIRDEQPDAMALGLPALREAISRWCSSPEQPCPAADIQITAGVQEAFLLASATLAESLGPLALPRVVQPGVRQILLDQEIGYEEVAVDPARGMLIELGSLSRALAAGCRQIYLESPVRLTGASYSEAELLAIHDLADAYEAMLIIDQGLAPWENQATAYSTLAAAAGSNLICIGELVPASGQASWQMGYILCAAPWRERIGAFREALRLGPGLALQFATLAAIDQFTTLHSQIQAERSARATRIRGAAMAAGLRPLPGSNSRIMAMQPTNMTEIMQQLAESGCGAIDGAAYGAAGTICLNIQNTELLMPLLEWLGSQKQSV